MNPRANSGKTSTASVFFKFFIFYTVLWAVIVNVMDILPKEGELRPHPDGWRPADTGDRAMSFVFLTMCFYAGGFFVVWLVMKIQRGASDVLFSGDPGYDEWRRQGGDPFVDALGVPLNNQSKRERWATGPANCCRCRTPLEARVSHGMNVTQCPSCGLVWCDGQWWEPPEG
jgi:hypothetical protein